jgi:hypothetical protein
LRVSDIAERRQEFHEKEDEDKDAGPGWRARVAANHFHNQRALEIALLLLNWLTTSIICCVPNTCLQTVAIKSRSCSLSSPQTPCPHGQSRASRRLHARFRAVPRRWQSWLVFACTSGQSTLIPIRVCQSMKFKMIYQSRTHRMLTTRLRTMTLIMKMTGWMLRCPTLPLLQPICLPQEEVRHLPDRMVYQKIPCTFPAQSAIRSSTVSLSFCLHVWG